MLWRCLTLKLQPLWTVVQLKHPAESAENTGGLPLQELVVLGKLTVDCLEPPGQLPHCAQVCGFLCCSLALLQTPEHPASACPPEQDDTMASFKTTCSMFWVCLKHALRCTLPGQH